MPVVDPHEALRKDFRNFLFVLWKHLGLPAPTPVQYEIAYYLQHGPKRRMVKAFRGVGKSYITIAYALWRIWLDPVNEKVLVVSAAKDRADENSKFARRILEEFSLMQHLRPRPGQRDSVVAFDVSMASTSQSPSFKSLGITGQLTGSRATLIIPDDVETAKNAMTQLMRERLSEAVKEFDSILIPGGDIVYLGTDQTEHSLYKKLPERGYDIRVWPARIPKAEKLAHYGNHLAPYVLQLIEKGFKAGAPVDAARFTDLDLLEREASYGRSGFAMQFMLDPSLSDAERYPLRTVDLIVMDLNPDKAPVYIAYGSGPDQTINDLEHVGFTGDKWVRPIHISEDWQEYTGSVMFVDPAGRGKDRVGYAVVKRLGGLLFLTAAGGLAGGYSPENLQRLALIAKEQKVNVIQVEPNFGDGMFTTLLKATLVAAGYPCTVEDAEWSKSQKEARIISILEPTLNQHKLVVDRKIIEADLKVVSDDSKSAAGVHQLFYQLTHITRERGSLKHDDVVEAVAGAVKYWVDVMGRDAKAAAEDLRARALEAELRKFMNGIGQAPTHDKYVPV